MIETNSSLLTKKWLVYTHSAQPKNMDTSRFGHWAIFVAPRIRSILIHSMEFFQRQVTSEGQGLCGYFLRLRPQFFCQVILK